MTARDAAGRALRALVGLGSLLAGAGAAHAAVNALLLRRPAASPPTVRERVSVLLPARDEAHQVRECLAAVLASNGVPDLEVLVLDDASRDGTGDLARAVAAGDTRLRVLTGAPLAPGWLGKPHACAQLAAAATGGVLVLLDADVRLAPHAIAAAVDLAARADLDLASPYPRQVAVTAAERLVQPLLQWSWLTTLPLRVAERSPRPSLAAANGQFTVLRAAALARAGGFAAVRDEVLDDVALVRAIKRTGGRGGVVDGRDLATCRMYTSWEELRAGYEKSLWSATGSPPAAAALLGALGITYVLPAAAALGGSGVGAAGWGAGVVGRVIAARRTGGRSWPDALAHPLSVLLLLRLVVGSRRERRRGRLAWKGRPLGAG